MIRKGRLVSNAGRDAGGSRDDDPFESSSRSASSSSASLSRSGDSPARVDPSETSDPFDPFESFDAHDHAAGHGSSRSRSDAASNGDVSETTYTRSRRVPGEGKSADDSAKTSKRPVRSLKGRALGYLSRREYSRSELSRKLTPYVEEGNSLEALLDTLEQEGWLSDSRFAESLIHRRASRMGAGRIVGELKRHAVGQTLIEEAGAQLRETELARAQAVWRKKFGELPQTPNDRAKQARFLAARGFSQSIIGKILKGIDEEWSAD